MEPKNISRPVMDVAVRPKQQPAASPAPTAPIAPAVQQPPADLDDPLPENDQKDSQPKPVISNQKQAEISAKKPAKNSSFPVGLFVATLTGMVTLAVLAILVYIKTN